MPKFKYFITNILSRTDVLITGGKDRRLYEGQYFNILDTSRKVIDPSTHEVLGKIYRFKFKMQVIEVWDNVSRLTTVNVDNNSLNRMISKPLGSSSKKEHLNLNPDSYPDDIFRTFSNAVVEVGDELVEAESYKANEFAEYRPFHRRIK